jgi:tRNA pseudouridine55 synthase
MARKREPARLHGLLVIDKPAGFTSHDVVAKIRRITGERKVGHAGTLDPMATGVLPVAVGDATRVIEYLAGASKAYRAEITFGVGTDTLDADGRLVAIDPGVRIDRETLDQAVTSFEGAFGQVPPMHAAIKIGGVRLYELARQGQEIDRPARPVIVHAIELVTWDPPVATIDVHCSKGFYVRSLARDLGERLGTVAHLSNLVRLSTGPFGLDDAWTLTDLEAFSRDEIADQWPTVALHPDALVGEMPAVIISEQERVRWAHGLGVSVAPVTGEQVSVYAERGDWLGIGHGDPARGQWLPDKVIGGRRAGDADEERGTT